jgi:hypothetical protein
LSIQNISSATGLSAKEVKRIQEETKKSSLWAKINFKALFKRFWYGVIFFTQKIT